MLRLLTGPEPEGLAVGSKQMSAADLVHLIHCAESCCLSSLAILYLVMYSLGAGPVGW